MGSHNTKQKFHDNDIEFAEQYKKQAKNAIEGNHISMLSLTFKNH